MKTDTATIQALLDNDQPKLTAILAAKQKALYAALGERCPECGSGNCAADEEQGHCDDCEAHWYTE
jgi:uncharacterized protein (DUF983 family)